MSYWLGILSSSRYSSRLYIRSRTFGSMSQKTLFSFFEKKSAEKRSKTDDASDTDPIAKKSKLLNGNSSEIVVEKESPQEVSTTPQKLSQILAKTPKRKVTKSRTNAPLFAGKSSKAASVSSENATQELESEKISPKNSLESASKSRENSPEKCHESAEQEKDESDEARYTNSKELSSQKSPKNHEPSPKTRPVDEKCNGDDNSTRNNISSYNPEATNYDPIEDACWKYGEEVPYLALAKTLQAVENTSKRLKIIDIVSNYFRSVIVLSKKDLLPSVYLCLNKLGPAYEGQQLGIADTYLMKAIAQCTGRTLAQVKSDVAETGDLGIVAEKSRSNQKLMFRPSSLTVQSVFKQLYEIANTTGNAAVSKKLDKIQTLFVACRECESKFIARSLAGKMRIGLAEQSVIQALALACTLTPPIQEYPPKILNFSKKVSADEFKKHADEELLILKTVYCECPNYGTIIPVLLEKGIKALPEHCKITPGIPVTPMLAQPTKGVQEVLSRFEGIEFTCEWKYDGERSQIHIMEGGEIKLYSRNMEDQTSKYPDIISGIRESVKSSVQSCILDAEAVAWDTVQKKIMPFQVLSTRKRKSVNIEDIKVQVCVFLFDLLYLNGESFVQKSFFERRNKLKEHCQEVESKFCFVKSIDTNTMEEVQEFLEVSVKGNCEGLMVKTLHVEATYEIAKRSRNWLKLKKDYLEGCGDTLDLIVIGGYIGKGKRTGHYGGFLLASYDAENEEYQAICKIGTGFSDDDLAKHSEFFKSHIIPQPRAYYRYDESHAPDHWFDAVQVWEIKCADLSLSPNYFAAIGLVDSEKGISLRFPRFLRVRDDKSPEEATASQQVADMYRNQDQIKNQANNDDSFNEEDF